MDHGSTHAHIRSAGKKSAAYGSTTGRDTAFKRQGNTGGEAHSFFKDSLAVDGSRQLSGSMLVLETSNTQIRHFKSL